MGCRYKPVDEQLCRLHRRDPAAPPPPPRRPTRTTKKRAAKKPPRPRPERRPRTRVPRLPLAPLEQRLPARPWATTDIGVSHTAWRNARRRGLSIWQAEEWAIAVGLHPAEVWGDAFYADLPTTAEGATDG